MPLRGTISTEFTEVEDALFVDLEAAATGLGGTAIGLAGLLLVIALRGGGLADAALAWVRGRVRLKRMKLGVMLRWGTYFSLGAFMT